MKRIAAWFGLLGGLALNAELLLAERRVNLPWLLFLGLSVLYFQRNGFLKTRSEASEE
ncbi:MAG: hypothetical protein VX519_09405 [Myxococcota bacterium]|nr:hypothetical protein [Myxococcota bacterium]